MLGGRRLSLRTAAGCEGARDWRAWNARLRMHRRKLGPARLCPNGACTSRLVILDFHRRARRLGDGLHLYRWIGGAKAEVASADGALREDRLFRPHRTPGGWGAEGRPVGPR